MSPGIMISQTWPDTCDSYGETVDALRFVVEDGYFQAVQTVHVQDKAERREIARLVAVSGVHYTYAIARLQKKQELNLSSLDESEQKRAVVAVTEMIDDAIEAGAHSVCIVSGRRPPNKDDRIISLSVLENSLVMLGRYASKSNIELLIEPLDFSADKMQSLGTIREAETLVSKLQTRGVAVGLCVDTAHMVLNRESLDASWFESTSDESPMRELHFCNAIIDKDHPDFGDKHIVFGSPGVLDVTDLPRLLKYALDSVVNARQSHLRVFCEILNSEPKNEAFGRNLYQYVKDLFLTLQEDT